MAEDFSPAISSIDEIIEDARNGKMYIPPISRLRKR